MCINCSFFTLILFIDEWFIRWHVYDVTFLLLMMSRQIFACKLCSFSTWSLKAFTTHFVIHKNAANFNFPCGVPGCMRTFTNYDSFKTHVYRDHNQYRKSNNPAKYQRVHLICDVKLCNFTCSDLFNLFGHLKMHLRNNVTVKCTFEKCKRSFTVVSSFSSQMSIEASSKLESQ